MYLSFINHSKYFSLPARTTPWVQNHEIISKERKPCLMRSWARADGRWEACAAPACRASRAGDSGVETGAKSWLTAVWRAIDSPAVVTFCRCWSACQTAAVSGRRFSGLIGLALSLSHRDINIGGRLCVCVCLHFTSLSAASTCIGWNRHF